MTHSINSLNIYVLIFLRIADTSGIPISSPDINNRLSSIRSSLEGEDLRLTLGKCCIGIEKECESYSLLFGRGDFCRVQSCWGDLSLASFCWARTW
jgi:hypothetical protein